MQLSKLFEFIFLSCELAVFDNASLLAAMYCAARAHTDIPNNDALTVCCTTFIIYLASAHDKQIWE